MVAPVCVLVTGANGQLGRALLRAPWPRDVAVLGRSRQEFDVACQPEVDARMALSGVDLVINAAAYTAVDRAETEVREAYAGNHHGPHNLAQACARVGAAMIHVSTDYVFDGTKETPYVEDDAISPVSAYGRSKAAGEQAVRDSLDRHVILRTAWLYSAGGSNFVKTMLRLAAEREEFSVVADQVGNPTSADDLAAAIVAMTGQLMSARNVAPAWGTYHCVNSGAATWADLASEVVASAAPRTGRQPTVRRITTAEYPTAAVRPKNSQLDCSKLAQAFGIRMRPWREALEPVVAQLTGSQHQ